MAQKKKITRDDILNEIRTVERVDRVMKNHYDIKNLND